jgi:hypothetical protein
VNRESLIRHQLIDNLRKFFDRIAAGINTGIGAMLAETEQAIAQRGKEELSRN